MDEQWVYSGVAGVVGVDGESIRRSCTLSKAKQHLKLLITRDSATNKLARSDRDNEVTCLCFEGASPLESTCVTTSPSTSLALVSRRIELGEFPPPCIKISA